MRPLAHFRRSLIFASMFGTRRLFVGLLMLMLAALTTIAAAHITGWHRAPTQLVNWGTLVNMLSILSATAFFVWLLAGDLKQALTRLEYENQPARIQRPH